MLNVLGFLQRKANYQHAKYQTPRERNKKRMPSGLSRTVDWRQRKLIQAPNSRKRYSMIQKHDFISVITFLSGTQRAGSSLVHKENVVSTES